MTRGFPEPADAATGSAPHRVARYLAAIAPIDDAKLAGHVDSLLADLPAGIDLAGAVSLAQERVAEWWRLAFDDVEIGDVAARRALVRLPDAFLSRRSSDLQALQRLRRRLAEPALLPPQHLARPKVEAWARLLPFAAGAIVAAFWCAHAITAPALIDSLWSIVFGLLFGFQFHSAVLAILGLIHRDAPAAPAAATSLPPTAVCMPIYEEDPQRVFAALAAMREELVRTGRADRFAFYVLSDTQDAFRAADEERAWRRLAALAGEQLPVYYRRRPLNVGKKAGNIAEFAVHNLHRFTYAVILDADSLTGARTIVSLVERMEREPALGLLQAPIALHGAQTLFARILGFGHAVAGPLLHRGLRVWSGMDGNYFGHNAVVRLRAFVECCGLPTLQGSPPLGGPILSHDFVEAALLRRGGWEVRFAEGVDDTFEESPPTLEDYLKRDRRWCQGNLQHLRVVFAEGLTFVSRLHLLFGALAYLISPLWLVFLVGGVLVWLTGGTASVELAVPLTLITMTVLVLPRVLGLLDALVMRRQKFGGPIRLLAGGILELVASSLLAPLFLLMQTEFIAEILDGRAIEWRAQRRRLGTRRVALDRRLARMSLVGLATGAVLLIAARPLAWTLAPVWIPWALAAPLAVLLARRSPAALSLFATPAELEAPPILGAARRLESEFQADPRARFRDIILDPVLNARRRSELALRQVPSNPELAALADRAIALGPGALSPEERDRLLDDSAELERLHARAWQEWPVEAWPVPRPAPAEPPGAASLVSVERMPDG